MQKYGGLRWNDPDNGYHICEAHPEKMFFEKRGNNNYCIFATYQGFDLSKPLEKQKDKYDGWSKTWKDFYEEVVNYYKDSHEVKCYIKGRQCDSDTDSDCDEEEEISL